MPSDLTGAKRDEFLNRRIGLSSAASGSSFLRRVYQRPLFLLMAMIGARSPACELANLMLARSASRKSEFAIRLALGASRWQLIRQLLMESLILSLTGALTGLLLARYAAAYLLSAMWSGFVPLTLSAEPDLRVLTFTVLATLATGIAFSVLPARGVARLGETSRSVRRGGSSGRVLIPVQIALSLSLVLTALVLVRSLQNLHTADVGFRNEGMLVIQMFPAGSETQQIPGRTTYIGKSSTASAHFRGLKA